MARRWWEEPVEPAAPRLRRQLTDQEFFAEQQAVEDELFARDRADDSQTQRALNQSLAQIEAAPKAVRGLARSLIGGDGSEDLRAAQRIIDREAQFAPEVQRLEDIQDGGDLAAYGRNAVLSNLPTLLPTLGAAALTGGTSAVAGAGLRGLAKRGLTRAVGNALTARAGTTAGAVAGSSAMQANQVIEAALDDSTGEDAQTRAAKATVGAIATGALDALPQISLLGRLGLGGTVKRAIGPEIQRHLAARLATEGGKQALQEGATEAIQTLGEKLTHRWVNDNVEVLGPQAWSDYLNAGVAGALVGGVIGAPAGLRGGDTSQIRKRVKESMSWFKDKVPSGPIPANAVSDAVRGAEDAVIDAAGKVTGSATTGKAVKAATELGGKAKDAAGKVGETVQEVFEQAKQTLDPQQENPPKIISWLFGKNQGIVATEDSLLDDLENSFREIDQGGRAPSDANGIIGRTQNDGFVRGGVPFNGFSLFNAEQAQTIWETARTNGQPISVGDAFAITSLAPGQHAEVGDAAIKAAGKFLLTGDRSQVDEDALTKYLSALEPDQRLQFMYASAHTAENIAKAREASTELEELTPQALRKTMDSQTEALRTAVDVEDKADFDLAAEFGEDTGDFADFQQQQAMDEERPAPISLNEVVRALPFVDTRDGPRAGAVRVTNSKGNPRDVSLASLVAQGWQAVKDGVFTAPNGVVDVVAQAIDVLQQRGLKIDPSEIKPGLWLGGETRLSPAQAKQIRAGMAPSRARPVQETPGMGQVPPGERPFDNAAIEGEQETAGEDGIENLVGEDTALRPRARSPLGTRVSETGQVTEAETIDTDAADNISQDQRRAETDAIDALHRANEVIAPGTTLKGRNLDQLIENFARRANALKTRTKKQQEAIDGARRAIQRIERQPREEAETVKTRTFERFDKNLGRKISVTQRELGILPEMSPADQEALELIEDRLSADNGIGEFLLSSDSELENWSDTGSGQFSQQELAGTLGAMLQTPEGRQEVLDRAARSYSSNNLVALMGASRKLLRSSTVAPADQHAFMAKLFARFRAAQERLRRSQMIAPGRNITFYAHLSKWQQINDLLEQGASSVAVMANRLLDQPGLISPRQRAMLQAMVKSEVLKTVPFNPDVDYDLTGNAPIFISNPQQTAVLMPPIDSLHMGLKGFILGMHPVDVFIHESTHAMTFHGEQASPQIASDINRLLQHVRAKATELGYPVDIMYGLLDTQEFLAEAFSNAEFQGILRRIPAANTKTFRNAWEQFKSIIAKLFKLEPNMAGTALEEALTLGLAAAGTTRRVMEFNRYVREQMAKQMTELSAEAEAGRVFAPSLLTHNPQVASTPASLFSLLNTNDRGILEKALRDPGVFKQVFEAAPQQVQQQLALYGHDLPTLINFAAALHAQGKLKLDAGTSPLTKLVNLVRRTLGLPDNTAVAAQILADYQANQIVAGRYDAEAKAFGKNDYTKAVLAVERAVLRVAQPVVDKLTTDVGTRMRETNNPALRKLATLIETRNAENAGGESFVALRGRWMSQHATAYMEAVSGLKEDQKQELARALQTYERPTGALGIHFDNITALLERYRLWFNAQIGASVRGIPKRANYFPVVMDRKRVEEHWDELVSLLSNPAYESDIRAFFDNDNKTPITELIDRMAQIAQTADTSHVGEVDFSTGMYSPAMSARRQQIMGFITSKVTDRKALAKFQTNSLDAIMLGYVNQMTKRAAKIKVFGEARTVRDATGSKTIPDRIGRLMAQAKAQGASPEQMALARDFVNMALGSYNAELNPAVRWVFRQVDKVWGGELAEMPIEQWAHYQQAAMTYQNVRLLGLAALSSLIDPLGSLVRGGSIRGTARSMWDAARAMRDENDTLRQMGEYLGVVEKYALSDAIAATYGGSFDPQGRLGKINNALFRYNGLEAITRHSRLTALAMGHRFLIRHSETPNEHSERLLQELDLTAADIQRDPAQPNFVVMTPKIEQALRRFVAEAVVRPSPSQRPGWHNDPNFLFAAQYKGYLYAFYTTIVDRMVKEAAQGNHRQALIPLIPYLGVTVAAELTRHAIQHPGEEPPEEDELMQRALVRSGLVGPRFGVFNDARTDARYGSWVTNSWIGPSGQQVTDLVDVATGDRSFGKTAVEALPGSAIFEDWNP